MADPFLDTGAVVACVVGAVGLRTLVGRGLPLWGLVLLLAGPIAALLVGRPAFSFFAYHGSMHTAITYEIFEGGLPPEHPLLAGTRLGYPHAHHALVAWLIRVLPFPPPVFFALTSLLCLPAAALALDRIARQLSPDALVHRYAVIFALLGLAPFSLGPLADLAGASGLAIEPRLIPLHKFSTVNSMQLGMTLFLLCLWGLVSLFGEAARPRRSLAAIAAGLGLAGLAYPIAGAFAAAATGAVSLWGLVCGSDRSRRAAVLSGGLLVATSALLTPYYLYLHAGRAHPPLAALSGSQAGRHLMILLPYLSLPAALLWARRADLRSALRSHPGPVGLLAGIFVLSVPAFALLPLPLATEYKFLLMGSLALGPLAALAARGLHHDRPALTVALLALALLPWTRFVLEVASGWPVTHGIVADRSLLRHADPVEDALHRWIAAGTPRESVVVDTELTVPVLSRRPLLAVCGGRRPAGAPRNGWAPSHRVASLPMLGGDARVYGRRCALVRPLLAAHGPPPNEGQLRRLRAEVAPRPLFVVARQPGLIERLGATPHLRSVFRNPAAAVFRLDDDQFPR